MKKGTIILGLAIFIPMAVVLIIDLHCGRIPAGWVSGSAMVGLVIYVVGDTWPEKRPNLMEFIHQVLRPR